MILISLTTCVAFNHFIAIFLIIIDEEASGQAADLRDNCGTFIKSLSDFADIAKGFIEIFDAVAKEVEKQKIQAIGAQNLLQTNTS